MTTLGDFISMCESAVGTRDPVAMRECVKLARQISDDYMNLQRSAPVDMPPLPNDLRLRMDKLMALRGRLLNDPVEAKSYPEDTVIRIMIFAEAASAKFRADLIETKAAMEAPAPAPPVAPAASVAPKPPSAQSPLQPAITPAPAPAANDQRREKLSGPAVPWSAADAKLLADLRDDSEVLQLVARLPQSRLTERPGIARDISTKCEAKILGLSRLVKRMAWGPDRRAAQVKVSEFERVVAQLPLPNKL